jgi:hypothetical protein
MEEETDAARFMRFAIAIANNIPTPDGEELGYMLIEEYGSNTEALLLAILQWLQKLNFSLEDSGLIMRAALTHSGYMLFNTNKTQKVYKQ